MTAMPGSDKRRSRELRRTGSFSCTSLMKRTCTTSEAPPMEDLRSAIGNSPRRFRHRSAGAWVGRDSATSNALSGPSPNRLTALHVFLSALDDLGGRRQLEAVPCVHVAAFGELLVQGLRPERKGERHEERQEPGDGFHSGPSCAREVDSSVRWPTLSAALAGALTRSRAAAPRCRP